MKNLIIPFSVLFLLGCGSEALETAADDSTTDSTTQEVVVEQEKIIDITLTKLDEVPSACETEGKTVDAYSWKDENGTNYFIRTMGEAEMEYPETDGDDKYSQYLYAYHYVENLKGEFSLLRQITDFIKDCEFDIIVSHELDALELSDLDQDSYGEITFVYRTACTSDVSPSTQKLIMLEDGEKYAIRGTTSVMGEGGEFEMGEEFESAPETFQPWAENIWADHLNEYDFEL
ncbi:MAG: hypothetical protein ACI857_000360 [Arenicella sp.]|jgi:hypothetical protein